MTHTHTHTHTSGPWTCAEQDDWDGAHIIDKHGRIIADCQGCDIPGTYGEVGTDEAKANAYLIAAAPELLAVCVRLLAYEQRLTTSKEDGGPQLATDIRAAIAKAEGNATA